MPPGRPPLNTLTINHRVCARAGVRQIDSLDTYEQASFKFNAWLDEVSAVYEQLCEQRSPVRVRTLVIQTMLQWLKQMAFKYIPDQYMSAIDFIGIFMSSSVVVKVINVLQQGLGLTMPQVAQVLPQVQQVALIAYTTIMDEARIRSRVATPTPAAAVCALLLC